MFNFFKSKEKFLLLDVLPERIGGLLISLDDKKRIRREKFWENVEKNTPSKFPPLIALPDKTIVAADPELVVKTSITLVMKRESHSEPLERFELENLIAQAVGKVFNHYRREASTILGLDELNMILADSNISRFEVDGHKIMSPVGFKPREIKAVMEITFTARETFDRVKSIVKGANIFFTERGQAKAEVISKIDGKRANFLLVGREKSYLYADDAELKGVFVRHQLKWSVEKLISEISHAWALNEIAARNIYEYYCREKVSPTMEKRFEKIFSRPVNELSNQVKKSKTAEKIYVVGIPVKLVGKNPFHELPSHGFAEKLGFSMGNAGLSLSVDEFLKLAPFLEFYYDNSDSEINGWLKRRLHWLGSAT